MPRIISGAGYTLGITPPEKHLPVLAAPKSHKIGGPLVMGMGIDR